jgi:hypothetical protein
MCPRHATAPRAARFRRMGSHIVALTGAVAAALALEAWLGDGFTWLPRSGVALVAALAVFVLGEGFLQWLMRQAKSVAEEDVIFRAVSSPEPRGRDRNTS